MDENVPSLDIECDRWVLPPLGINDRIFVRDLVVYLKNHGWSIVESVNPPDVTIRSMDDALDRIFSRKQCELRFSKPSVLQKGDGPVVTFGLGHMDQVTTSWTVAGEQDPFDEIMCRFRQSPKESDGSD